MSGFSLINVRYPRYQDTAFFQLCLRKPDPLNSAKSISCVKFQTSNAPPLIFFARGSSCCSSWGCCCYCCFCDSGKIKSTPTPKTEVWTLDWILTIMRRRMRLWSCGIKKWDWDSDAKVSKLETKTETALVSGSVLKHEIREVEKSFIEELSSTEKLKSQIKDLEKSIKIKTAMI